jgi:DNA-binding CsgD family transcriptional regulator/PAS domain-containing protein
MNVDISKLIADIHQAQLNPEKWRAVLEDLRVLAGASSGNLIITGLQSQAPLVLASTEIDQTAINDYHAYYHRYDIWLAESRSQKPGSVLRGPDIVADETFLKSTWFNDFLRQQDIGKLLTGRLQSDRLNGDSFSLYRPWRDDEFNAAAEQFLREALPHLSSAVTVYRHLFDLEQRLAATETAFDRLPIGVVLLDRRGRLLHANRLAWEVVRTRDGLDLQLSRLTAANPEEQRKLERLILSTAATGRGRMATPGGSLTISRTSLKPSYSVFIAPISDQGSEQPGILGDLQPSAIAIINNPEWMAQIPSDVLQERYGLTSAEARLAAGLAAGSSLKEASEKFGVSTGTVRTQLKQIFTKTNTHRQIDLVRLLVADLASLAAAADHPSSNEPPDPNDGS